MSHSGFRLLQHQTGTLFLLLFAFSCMAENLYAQERNVYGQVIQTANNTGLARPTASNAVAPLTTGPNTREPNNMSPVVTEPNRMSPNTTPSSIAQYAPNPDGSLPIRPGAVVNPRTMSDGNVTLNQTGKNEQSGQYGQYAPNGSYRPINQQGQSGQQAPLGSNVITMQQPGYAQSNGPIQQTAGLQASEAGLGAGSGYGIIRADNIPNTGTPGGPRPAVQESRVPQPVRPTLSTPKTGQPFPPLTPEQLAELNQFLTVWEQKTGQTKRFEAKFRCFQYGTDLLVEKTGPDANTPDFITYGWLRYVSPNKAVFNVEGEILDKKEVPGRRQEKFIITEQSIFSYDFDEKKRTEYRIPPEQQGTQLSAAGPLPFVFGAKAEDLKKRYYLQLITPEKGKGSEIHLEVWPRWEEDTDEFRCVQLIVDAKTLVPKGLVKFGVNGKEKTTYVFDSRSIRIDNRLDSIRDFLSEYFKPDIGPGWKSEVRDLPASGESLSNSRVPSNASSNPDFSQGAGVASTQTVPMLNNPQPNYGSMQQGNGPLVGGQSGSGLQGTIPSNRVQPNPPLQSPLEVPLYVPNVPQP